MPTLGLEASLDMFVKAAQTSVRSGITYGEAYARSVMRGLWRGRSAPYLQIVCAHSVSLASENETPRSFCDACQQSQSRAYVIRVLRSA